MCGESSQNVGQYPRCCLTYPPATGTSREATPQIRSTSTPLMAAIDSRVTPLGNGYRYKLRDHPYQEATGSTQTADRALPKDQLEESCTSH